VSTGQSTVPASTRGQRTFIGLAILIFAATSAYLALVIITRVDSIFFPGNQITLASVPGGEAITKNLPGVDGEGTSGSQDRINILVLGLDRRPQDGDTPSRTDTIFIVTVDPKTKSSGILGIPRDYWVDVPYSEGSGTYQDRINSVYVAGELNGYEQGGVGLMKDVLEAEPFNIKID
jgi:anionic cell wall polymer biosynthesis LytR-Cps2A-Psr (LCP) family protein